MKKLLVELEYNTNIMCATSKDEQDLIRILSNAVIVKHDYLDNKLHLTRDNFKLKMVFAEEIYPELQPEVTGNE